MTAHAVVERAAPGRPGEPDRAWPQAVSEGRALLARKARSFHLATALLPVPVQDDVAVLYGFCRLADDLADEPRSRAGAAAALDRLEAELLGVARPRTLIAGYRHMAWRHAMPLGPARTLLRGVRTDLADVAIEDDVALLRYCYRVAATVGLMLNRVLGVAGTEADACAVDLGLAMQLTNIVRDVREDAQQGRVYLPRHRLAAHGTSPEAMLAGTAPRPAVRAVALELLALADALYGHAASGLGFIPLRARPGIAAAYRLYASIGWRIRRRGHHPLDGRMVVPRLEKGWRLVEAAGLAAWTSLPGRRPTRLAPALQVTRDAACAGA